MRTPAYYSAKVIEMERLAAQSPPGQEREALLKTAEYLRDMANLAAWREREPRAPRPTTGSRPGA